MEQPSELKWSFALPDWRERLLAGIGLVPPLPLDKVAVAKAVGIYNKLRLPDVAGKPELRLAGGEWYRQIVGAIFGSLDHTGYRQVRNVFVMVPKKSSKTTNAGATMVTGVLMDDEPLQNYFLYGPTQAIADRGFAQASGMIRADEVLTARFHIADHRKTITDRKTDTSLRVQTFDKSVATGVIPKGILLDEIHLLGKVAYAARVLGQLQGGMLARPGAFILKITTQSDEPPAGVFAAELELARAIRDGRVTGPGASLLPVLYEFDEAFQRSGAWRDSETWHRVLPNLGKSIRLDMLQADFSAAQAKGEEEVRRWASQHLNIQIGLGLHSERWLGADYWENAGVASLRDLAAMLARCEVAVIGIDGGGLDDLTGVCVTGRDRRTGVWLYWFRAFAHRKVLKLRKEIASVLEGFEADGDLMFWGDADARADVAAVLDDDEAADAARLATDRDVVAIVAICEQVRDSGLMPENSGIGVDAAALGAIADGLEAAGFTIAGAGTGDVVSISQSATNMNSAILTLQRKLEAGMAGHGGTRLMAWCVGNAKAVQKGNAVSITKAESGKGKIDPLIAGFVATKLMERNPVAAGHSAYATRGLLTV